MSNLKKTLHGLRLACITLITASTYAQNGSTALPADTSAMVVDTLGEPIEVVEVQEVPTVPEAILRGRLAKLERSIPLNYNKTVHGFVDYFTFRKPSYTKKVLERVPMFFPLYERLLAQYELPDELKYLSIVESSLDPRAVSRVGAGGLWQFMPYTGSDFHLYQDEYIDERMDPVKSTEAACRFLKQLYNVFGDWHLALAAYNSGPGTVKRAMRRSGGDSFWTIYDYLPKETRAYVPQFIALTYMMNHANDHGIYAEQPEYPIPCDTIHVNGYLSMALFAKNTGIPLADMKKMNPCVMMDVLPDQTRNFVLRVPRSHFDYFTANRRTIMDSSGRPAIVTNMLLASTESVNYGLDSARKNDYFPFTNANEEQARQSTPVVAANPISEEDEDIEKVVKQKPKKLTHVVKRGEVLMQIADHYHVEVYDLKKWNHLRSTVIKRGQKLTILREPAVPSSRQVKSVEPERAESREEVAKHSKSYKPKYHRVQEGDTLWNISQRYNNLSVEELKKMNNIKGNSLKLGQRLIVG